ncbi:MAG: hypothetical protein FWC23_08600 [Chitinispirillia bacterium]|nr:hypothetical protein [Chitinispirillia bacterium]MCL2269227.1 hypothetical protein [Chitinispirillia bacterium]
MRRTGVLVAAALAACLSVGLGCAKKVSVEEGRAKIQELSNRGVPERQMSDLKMYLFQMETAQKTGNGSMFRIYRDSLTTALAEFESKMAGMLESAGPFMDSVMTAADAKIAGLKGLHLEQAKKLRGPVDSIRQIESQKLDARNRVEAFGFEVDTLIIQQKLADSLRGEFVGVWVMEQEPADPRFKMVERTEIHMWPDGGLFIMEGKKGQINEQAKEDWLFESRGTWDIKGDMVYHYINKEKRVRQIFEGVDHTTGSWRKQSQPPYDSTVNRGAKYVAWDELNKDYKRFPINRQSGRR